MGHTRCQGLEFGYDLGLLNCSRGTVFSLETVKQLRILDTRWDVYMDCYHLH